MPTPRLPCVLRSVFGRVLLLLLLRREADVRKLLPEGLLDDARAQEVAKAYNAQEGVIVEVGAKWLVCVC